MGDFPNLDPKMHEALFRITDEMRRLRLDRGSVSAGEYHRILKELCGALQESCRHGLQQAIFYTQAQANDPEQRAAARQIVSDLGRFSEFIAIEKDILLKCGVSENAADDILEQVSALREHYRAETFNADEVWHHAAALRDGACTAADGVDAHFRDRERFHEDRKRAMRTYGTALIAANLSALAFSAGGSAPVSFVSSGFGGLLLTWTGFLKEHGSERLR